MSTILSRLASVANRAAGRRARPVPVYTVMLSVGLVTALVVGDALSRRTGLDPVRVVAVFVVSIPVCLAGARGLAVALAWNRFRGDPRAILRPHRHGGAAMYGALPPAVLFTIPLLRWLGLPIGAFWDIAVVAILAGMIPTRFGCLGAGCCAGRPTSSLLGMRLRNARGVCERRIPSPLLEALLGAVLLAAALALFGRLPFPGAVALFVTAGYGAGRLFLEGLREERVPRLAGLGTFQWMSAALVLVGVVGLYLGWTTGASPGFERAAPSAPTGLGHLLAAGLLLLPIVHLFRFLGCSLLLGSTPAVKHLLQMIAIVPDIGSGDVSVTIRFEKEPELTEIDESPVELAPAGVQPDGRLSFEALTEIPEGAYRATCTVSRTGAITRIGSCSGELTGPGLVLAFNAEIGDAPATLTPRVCFEPLSSP